MHRKPLTRHDTKIENRDARVTTDGQRSIDALGGVLEPVMHIRVWRLHSQG